MTLVLVVSSSLDYVCICSDVTPRAPGRVLLPRPSPPDPRRTFPGRVVTAHWWEGGRGGVREPIAVPGQRVSLRGRVGATDPFGGQNKGLRWGGVCGKKKKKVSNVKPGKASASLGPPSRLRSPTLRDGTVHHGRGRNPSGKGAGGEAGERDGDSRRGLREAETS